jgi:chromate transporter
MTRVIHLFLVFALLGVLAMGGGTAVLPEMQHMTVHTFGWLTDKQFRDIYSLGQVAPGPNMLMVLVIGYRMAGALGALAVGIGFFVPDCILTLVVNRWWEHLQSPWRVSVQRGMAPVAIGLMLSGTWAIARLAVFGAITINFEAMALALAVFAILLWRHVNPGVLVVVGGVIYLFLPH